MSSSVEILAPAGSLESLKAAIDSGADAVYFGGDRFSARRNAVNLSESDISEAVNYAHLRGACLYAAVNTLMFDSELEGVFDFIKFLYESGVDGVIVQDFGVFSIMKKYFPDMRVHASTQMTVHNLAGALWAQKMGFSRVVLSRELSLSEIKHISENSSIELEVFVHGALCMSYSGQCLFSSFLGGRSGNRGFCAQPCRLNYTLTDSGGAELSEKNKYLLSLKDLSLIDYVEELKEAGVTSFKIEGRMKGTAYVSAVAGMFNKYRGGQKVSADDRELLGNIFSRNGFTDGYFKGVSGRHMLNYDKSNDDIYESATDDVVSSALNLANISKKYKIDARFTAYAGEKACFEAEYDGKVFAVQSSGIVAEAQNKPSDSERIAQQLEKLGGTLFSYNSLEVCCGDDIFMPVREINDMRRTVAQSIETYILGTKPEYNGGKFTLFRAGGKKTEPCHTASVLTEAQAEAAYNLGFEKIYIPYSVYQKDKPRYDADGDVFAVKLPPVNHDRFDWDFSDIGTDSVCVTNIGQFGMLNENRELISDYRLNVTNSMSIRFLAGLGVKRICISPELTIGQIKDLTKSCGTEIVVYGKIALMTVKNCLVNSSLGKCGCTPGEVYYLKDRKSISFPLFADKSTCTNVIYNSAPIYMADRMKELRESGAEAYRFDFTDESPEQIAEIVRMYEKGLKSSGFFTRGHFYNGIS